MAISWSAVASIVYFAVYTTMMILLAMFVWKKEDHKLDRTFLKSIWIQRKIYAQVIVHFYDTATDIGVLITWYFLYTDDYDYESVDMAVFFWSGCAVALFYRFVSFLVSMWVESDKGEENGDDNTMVTMKVCIKLPLIIFDLFILDAVYESFKSAEQVLEENAKKAKAKRDRIARKKAAKVWKIVDDKLVSCLLDKVVGDIQQTFNQIDLNNDGIIDQQELQSILQKHDGFTDEQVIQCFEEVDRNKDGTIDYQDFSKWYQRALVKQKKNNSTKPMENLQKQIELTTNAQTVQNEEYKTEEITEYNVNAIELTEEDEKDVELDDIDPAIVQYYCMLAEAVFESMPQVILQSVFLFRGSNDDILSKNSNQILIFISLIASIFSVANKFYLMDKLGVEDKAKSLKPKKQFPTCVQPWYLVRISWRFFHILCRFSIFSLLWIVLGGVPFGIYVGLSTFGICCCGGGCLICCILWDEWNGSICNKCISSNDDIASGEQILLFLFLGTVACPLFDRSLPVYIPRWTENCILLGVITYFTMVEFECNYCTDKSQRQISYNKNILTLLIIGWTSWFMDIVLFLMLQLFGIILKEPQNLPKS